MTYEIKQPYQHQVYSAKIGHFDIVVDIESFTLSPWTIVSATSKIGDVVFYSEEDQSTMIYEDAYNKYMSEEGIQKIVDLSKERLNELYIKVSE